MSEFQSWSIQGLQDCACDSSLDGYPVQSPVLAESYMHEGRSEKRGSSLETWCREVILSSMLKGIHQH